MPKIEEQQPLRFTAFQLDSAPTQPGVYAWYVQLPLSAGDWKPHVVDGQDMTPASFTAGVSRYGRCFRPERVTLTGRSTYGARWTGEIAGTELAAMIEAAQPGQDGTPADALIAAADNVMQRRVVLEILRASLPVFSAPAYIGVASNLRDRLLQHLSDYERALEYLGNHPDDANELRERGRTFGTRAAGAQIAMNQFVVFALPAPAIADVSDETSRDAAEVAEWTLQRIFRPAFGKD